MVTRPIAAWNVVEWNEKNEIQNGDNAAVGADLYGAGRRCR
jgi:hypothetical protein